MTLSDPVIEIMQQLASEINKPRRESSLMAPYLIMLRVRDCLSGDELQKRIRKWLCPPDPWTNHNVARKSQHSGTGVWWIQGDTFSDWKYSGPSSLLWIHGKR